MSAEGKKKRGESGLSNAKNIPFRYGGSKCDYSTHHGRTTSPYGAGSALINALRIGLLFPNEGLSAKMLRTADAAMGRCTSPHLI